MAFTIIEVVLIVAVCLDMLVRYRQYIQHEELLRRLSLFEQKAYMLGLDLDKLRAMLSRLIALIEQINIFGSGKIL